MRDSSTKAILSIRDGTKLAKMRDRADVRRPISLTQSHSVRFSSLARNSSFQFPDHVLNDACVPLRRITGRTWARDTFLKKVCDVFVAKRTSIMKRIQYSTVYKARFLQNIKLQKYTKRAPGTPDGQLHGLPI